MPYDFRSSVITHTGVMSLVFNIQNRITVLSKSRKSGTSGASVLEE